MRFTSDEEVTDVAVVEENALLKKGIPTNVMMTAPSGTRGFVAGRSLVDHALYTFIIADGLEPEQQHKQVEVQPSHLLGFVCDDGRVIA